MIIDGDSKTPVTSASGLTTRDLLAMLACGETLELADRKPFAIEDGTARKALAWFIGDPVGRQYLEKPPERGNADMAGLLTWIESGQLLTRPTVAANATDKRLWSLISLNVRQFGGLQPFCAEDGTDAPDIMISLARPLFVAQGPNGAGKTSLARVLTFLLTGKVASTPNFQHFYDPEQINTYQFSDGTTIELPTVVPMPTLAQWQVRKDKEGHPITTSVTAEFCAKQGQKVMVCRKVVPTKTGFSTVLEKNGVRVEGEFHTVLGISALALELSALQMSRLGHLKLGHRESLADGVRALTGLRDVAALAEKTAPKLEEYLGTTYAKNQRTLAKTETDRFTQQTAILREAFSKAAAPSMPLAPEGNGSVCQATLLALKNDLDDRAARVRAAVATAAGVGEDKVELESLGDKLVIARNLIVPSTLNSAGLAALVAATENLSDDNVHQVRNLLDAFIERANNFAVLQLDKLKTSRRRHHARIAAGLQEEGQAIPPTECPTCVRALNDNVRDDVLDMPVAEAIAVGAHESEDLKFTVEQFDKSVKESLWSSLPEPAASCLKLLARLTSVSSVGWATSIVSNVDASLDKFPALKNVVAIAHKMLLEGMAGLSAFPIPPISSLSPIFAGTSVERAAKQLTMLLELSDWTQTTREARASLINDIYGTVGAVTSNQSLVGKIDELHMLLNAYSPVSTGKEVLKALNNHYNAWNKATTLAENAASAAEAVGKLVSLKRVVEVQVEGLFRDVNTDMDRYRKMFYQPPGHAGPQAGLVRYDGVALQISAEVEGAVGSANNIANSSQLRALLFSFILALLQSVWKHEGGLTLVLLDDPQLLFDEANQIRLAKGLVACTHEKFCPIIMTFDRVFTARLARAGDCREGAAISAQIEIHQIVPRGEIYACVRLKPDLLTLNQKRDEWTRDKADSERIIIFSREARSFMEHTMVDLLAEAAEPVYDHPTLAPLRERVQRLVNRPGVIQNAEPFSRLLHLLPDGSADKETLGEALNWSNHFQATDLRQIHAQAVDDVLDRFLDLREQCMDILVNRTSSKPLPKPANANKALGGAPAPACVVRLVGLLAASQGESGPDADQSMGGQQIRTIAPETHQAFGLGQAAQWLPYPLKSSSMVICERDSVTPKKGDFVVVADRSTGQSRLGWCRMDDDRILLAGLGGKFIASLTAENCDIFSVVGAVFDGGAVNPRPCHPLHKPSLLKSCKHVAEISAGDSAEPLMKKGDLVLLTSEVSSDTVFNAAQDTIFAVQLSDRRWVVKRLSGTANKAYRLLLPLGIYGTGEVVTFKPGNVGLTVNRAFPVVGLLR